MPVRWPWRRREPENLTSIGDPAIVDLFNIQPNYSGILVNESSALAISAFYRGVTLIAAAIAGLPLKTYRDTADGQRQQVRSWLDNPGGVLGQTSFEWKETCTLHMLLHGNVYLKHVYNRAGQIIGAVPIHPLQVTPEWEKDSEGRFTGRKVFTFMSDDGSLMKRTEVDMTQVMGPSLDGLRGLSLLGVARNSLGTTIGGDRAAAKLFKDGMTAAGLVTPEEELTAEEQAAVDRAIKSRATGWENAGSLAFVSKKLNFTPWAMSAEDAQFLGSRQFQIEEIARWTGVPPHLLMQTEKQTSWGTGVAEQNRGLSRFTLATWTGRFETRMSQTLGGPTFAEFDFAGLERPTPEQEIELLIKQVDAGLLTLNEARKIRNLPPLEGGDTSKALAAPQPTPLALPPAPVEDDFHVEQIIEGTP